MKITLYEKKHGTRRRHRIPQRYVPRSLTARDTQRQRQALKKSRRMYTRGKYYLRPSVTSFTSKKSSHLSRARRLYHVDTVAPTAELARQTGCSRRGLREIIRKGQGAYYSSGSRPNQTPASWGIARLASAITGGPASRIDRHILEKECSSNSPALQRARR